MASKKIFRSRPNYIHPEAETGESNDQNLFEFDESDVWNASDHHFPEKNPVPSSRSSKKSSKMSDSEADPRNRLVISSSLPVNILDWSKILKEEYRGRGKRESEDRVDSDEDDVSGDAGGIRDPPHEYLAKRRGASPSVHEGVGRTLKGRDLSRVRNAILKKTGLLD